MRTTLTIDTELLAAARELAVPDMNEEDLFREAICTFIRVRTAERLSSLGSKLPHMAAVQRRNTVSGKDVWDDWFDSPPLDDFMDDKGQPVTQKRENF